MSTIGSETVGEKIRRFFKRVTKKETYLVKLPEGLSMEDVIKFVDKVVAEENESLRAELAKAQSKLDEHAKQSGKEAQAQEQEIIDKAHEHAMKAKRDKYLHTIALMFYRYNPSKGEWEPFKRKPTFFLRSDRSFHKISGVFIQETKEGYQQWYPMLENGGKELLMFNAGAQSFNSFFRKKNGIVSQLLGGKLDSNFEIDEYDKPYFYNDDVLSDTERSESVRVIRLDDQERKQLEDENARLSDKLSEIFSEYKRLLRKEKYSQLENIEKEITSDVSKEQSETFAGALQSLAGQIPSLTRSVSDSIGAVSNLAINQRVSEMNSVAFLRALREKEIQMASQLSQAPREQERQELLTDLKLLQNIGSKMLSPNKTLSKEEMAQVIKLLKEPPKSVGVEPP